jgi:hypothetical protein
MNSNEKAILLALRRGHDHGLLHVKSQALERLKLLGYIDYISDMQGRLIDGTVSITTAGQIVTI